MRWEKNLTRDARAGRPAKKLEIRVEIEIGFPFIFIGLGQFYLGRRVEIGGGWRRVGKCLFGVDARPS
jgi:hypothetical protein